MYYIPVAYILSFIPVPKPKKYINQAQETKSQDALDVTLECCIHHAYVDMCSKQHKSHPYNSRCTRSARGGTKRVTQLCKAVHSRNMQKTGRSITRFPLQTILPNKLVTHFFCFSSLIVAMTFVSLEQTLTKWWV